MRGSILLVLVLTGCVADAPSDESAPIYTPEHSIEIVDERELGEVPAPEELDVCGLASALPADDVCSLICDPPAMARRLAKDGMDGGTCYQLRCELTETQSVLVGVCLP